MAGVFVLRDENSLLDLSIIGSYFTKVWKHLQYQ